jgi:signal transduction histidine kinase
MANQSDIRNPQSETANVLIVDDQPANLIALEAVLGDLGLNLLKAQSGREALRHCLNTDFAAIILDVQMPEMDGFEVAAVLHERERTKNTPIIFLTATDYAEESVFRGYQVGAVDFLFKPCPPEILRAKVWALVEIYKTRQELRRLNETLEEQVAERTMQLHQALMDLKAAQQFVVQQERLRALGQMAGGIAHDFNNALSPIMGYSELLLMVPGILDDKEKVTQYLHIINTGAKDAAKIVSRLREFYRQREEGEALLPVNINNLINQAVSLTQPKWKDQAQASGVTVTIQTDLGDVPTIPGNEAELRETLTNLIFNAVDAMPGGGVITIRTRSDFGLGISEGDASPKSEIRNPQSVVIEVSDTGAGMSEEVRRRCLEPFFTTKGERGTGLGLAMVYGIIRRHKGTIDIQSEPGKGTTFSLCLPLDQGEAVGVREQAMKAPSRPLRVLAVDDEPPVLEIISQYLAMYGHTVETATNGRTALKKFQAAAFDVVITDRAMPRMSGDQLAAAIKRASPQTPVIMLTGFGEFMNAAGERPEGVDLIVSKPVTIDSLLEALATATAEE